MHRTVRKLLVAITLLGLLFLAPYTNQALAAATLYVKPDVPVGRDCFTWGNACTLQEALEAAAPTGGEIWVAQGIYTPTVRLDTGDPRSVTFSLSNGVTVYGGFAGSEDMRDQRNIAANLTILSGDLARNDQTGGTNSENAYHVVVGSNTDSSAVLDGFTITGGNANGADLDSRGGGMLNQTGSPTVKNVTFSGNLAWDVGGGMYNISSSPVLTNVTFSSNSANLAALGFGGGMQNDFSSNPTLTDVTFSGNSAATSGGGMSNDSSSPTLTNVTFSNNSATYGGGMYNSSSDSTLTNVTFSNNSANNGGGGMYNVSSSPKLTNVIIANSTNGGDCVNLSGTLYPASSHNLIEDTVNACGLTNGANGNIIGVDPILGPLAYNGGATQTHALLTDSPAIDKGINSGCPTTDQRGMTRPVGAICDIGAFELYTGVYYVKPAATGNMDCRRWEDACTLQFALKASANGDQIWVAQGVYTPTTRLDPADPRSVTFSLTNGVGVYGGFAGTGSQRDIATNDTILSGDLLGDDQTGGSNAENAYHVVVGSGTDDTAVLDGFTITGGNANDALSPDRLGGGMYNHSGSPTVKNLTFSNNSATYGGGMYNNVSSSPALTDVTFSANEATYGGGMYNYFSSNPTQVRVTFSSNSAANNGGGMVNAGSSSPELANVTFSGNSAGFGGGMYNDSSSPLLTNVTIANNSASTVGGGMYNVANSRPRLTNVIIANSTNGGDCLNLGTTLNTVSSHNLIEDGNNACGLNNNVNIIGSDPKLGPLADNGGANQTHALLPRSPAIDAGSNSDCPATDQRGVARPQGKACDIGAYEAQIQLFLPLVQR